MSSILFDPGFVDIPLNACQLFSFSEPKSDVSPQFLQLVQEFLNLFNTSHPSPKFQEKLQSHLFNSLQQMPNAHLLTLPIISAGTCVCVCVCVCVCALLPGSTVVHSPSK